MKFDPLQIDQSIDQEIVNASKKREIKNILKSYVGYFDPFSELIQNAMDAIDRRRLLGDEDFTGKIKLRIDLNNQEFSITDNGIGFNEKEYKSFLAPNISFKDGKTTRGNKGVGATYIGYGFNYLQLGTKHPEFNFCGKIINGREWVEDLEGIVTRPEVVPDAPVHDAFEDIDRGSTFTIKFGGLYTRPKNLNWFMASTVDQWIYLLLIKTPLGSIDIFDKNEDYIQFDICVIDKDGNREEKDSINSQYIFPHSQISSSIQLSEILSYQKEQIEKGKDVSKLPAKYSRLNGIYERYSMEDIKKLKSNKIDKAEYQLIDNYEIEAYGYFTYSTSVWDHLNDNVANLRKGQRILKGGLQLSNNSMPQGELITIPLTSNIGYQNQAHIIVHFRNADPDLGRKGFQPELAELAQDISVAIVNNLKKWKVRLLKRDTGVTPDIEKDSQLHEWIKEQEKFEENFPLTISNEHFFKPVHEVSISSIPQSEQDAIVLFNQLIAGGVIRGIKLLSTSSSKQYDGIFRYESVEPTSNYMFDKVTNPLGVESLSISPGRQSKPKVLEYKFNVDALIKEFESEDKFEKDIDLIIAWELGKEWKKAYGITSLLNLENLHHRKFHGISHVLYSQTRNIEVVILQELVAYLNSVDDVQEYHKTTYEEDI